MNSEKFIQTLHCKPNKAIFYLYKKSKVVKNWVKANSGNDAEADDIIQEGVTILYQNLSKPNAQLSTAPENYLMGICKNLWLSELRKQKRLPTAQLNESMHVLEEEGASIKMPIEDVAKLLEQLGGKCNELLHLFYFQKKSMQFISEKLNFRNDKVAKAMKYKCLQKARQIVNPKH